MPRPCSVCVHEKREEIDQAIMRGDTYRSISQIYNVSPDAVSRHKKNGHIGKEIVEARQVEVVERSGDVWTQIDFWSGEIEAIYREAKQKHEKSVALTAIDKAMKLVALTAQLKAMAIEGTPGDGGIDPVNGAGLIMQYLHKHATKEVCDGLVEHLREQYELYGSDMIEMRGRK